MPNQQLPERVQRIIARLQEVWQHPQPISPNDLKRITEFVLELPEQYKQLGLAKIAEYATNNMSLHILNLMAIFQQFAEQEGIGASNVKDTLDHILPDTFRVLSDLNSQIQIQSLDDVAALTNITANLQVLSASETAGEAQSWLYELPTMYYQQLSQEKLMISTYPSTYISEQQDLSGASVMNPKTLFISKVSISSHTDPTPSFISEEDLKSVPDAKGYSEGVKHINNAVAA